MFAFAIWDEKEKKLFLARDRFGEKPVFFYQAGTQFLFASEMKALWAAGVKKESNKKLIFNFITIGYTQNPANGLETFYNGISKLPARSFLLFDAVTREMTTSLYWDIGIENTNSLKEENAIGQFNSLLISSVHKRLRRQRCPARDQPERRGWTVRPSSPRSSLNRASPENCKHFPPYSPASPKTNLLLSN